MTRKRAAWIATIALSMLFAAPGVRNALPEAQRAADSFPVSTFPMFSMPRPKEHRMTWVRALDAEGRSLGPVPSHVYNPGGMNQAMAHLRAARRNRPEKRAAICRAIAAGVARRWMHGVAQIEIYDAWYLPEKVFGPARDEVPERATVLVRCAVERPET